MAAAMSFTTPYAVASAVQKCGRAAGVALSLLPFQPKNDRGPWWLSPSPENPGYRYGKVLFGFDQGRPSDLFVGLYMEKGIGPTAGQLYAETRKGRRYIMDDDWLSRWQAFTEALVSGALDACFQNAEHQGARPVIVEVDAGHVPIPTPGERDDRPQFPREFVAFQWSAGAIAPLERVPSEETLLERCAQARSMSDLATKVSDLSREDSVWLDVGIGVRLSAADTWSAGQIWVRAVEPWLGWVRS